jgi:hypothetical protein
LRKEAQEEREVFILHGFTISRVRDYGGDDVFEKW